MNNAYGRLSWLTRLGKITTALALVTICLALALTIAYGILAATDSGNPLVIAAYAVAIVAWVALAMGVLVAYGVVLARAGTLAALVNLNGHMGRVQTLLQANQEKLEELTDLAPLSDQAKAMIYHDREIEAVQDVVHACLVRQEYEQAETLIDRMENQLGYHEEAQRMREAVTASRQNTEEGKIAAAVDRVRQIIDQKNWGRASREAQRLVEAFGDSELVAGLPGIIAEQQTRHKRELLQRYDEAVQRNDLDKSIELLGELDRYLTPPEAAALQESARGVFRAKLHNLGVQFAIAVTEERWSDAAAAGGQIANEFPNSRMAMEVNQKLHTLRQLANANAST